MAKMFLEKYFPPSMVTKLRNEITNFRQRLGESLFEAWERYKLSIDRCPNHNLLPVTQIDTFYNGLTLRHRDTINVAVGGTFMKRFPEECYDLIENMTAYHNDWDTSIQRTTVGQTQNVYAAGAYNQGGNNHENPQGNNQGSNQFFQRASHGQNPPPAYEAPSYQALGYQAPVQQASIPQPQVVTTTEFTNYMKADDVILKNIQTNMTSLTNSNLKLKNMFGQFMKMNTASSLEPVVAPVETLVSAPKPNPIPSIPYPSRLHDQKLRDKANDQKEKFSQIFHDLNFNISFANALILMPKFGLTIKSLLTNKDKLFELARTPLNEHCSAILLKKLLEKLRTLANFSSRVIFQEWMSA
nr:reverse transcriptase domain-containing protein [Tanacetum cinerariifolium]